MRIFIAIDLDPNLKNSLQDLIRKLQKTGSHVKWVGLQGMHLTLKFLGETDPETILSVEGEIRRAVSEYSPFSLTFSGTGVFPGESRPRVLWIGLHDEPVLLRLQKSLEEGLKGLGFPAESRPFRPHLTLGRVKGPSGLRDVGADFSKYRDSYFGEMRVDRVALFQSVLKPAGAQYNILSEFPFP